jgi:hypothetical protein
MQNQDYFGNMVCPENISELFEESSSSTLYYSNGWKSRLGKHRMRRVADSEHELRGLCLKRSVKSLRKQEATFPVVI